MNRLISFKINYLKSICNWIYIPMYHIVTLVYDVPITSHYLV